MNKSKKILQKADTKEQQLVHENISSLFQKSRQMYNNSSEILMRLKENYDDPNFEKEMAKAKQLQREGDRLMKQVKIEISMLKKSNFKPINNTI